MTTQPTTTANPTRTADCQECGEHGEGCGRPWTDHRGATHAPHTCWECHDRMDAEADAKHEAAAKREARAMGHAEMVRDCGAYGGAPSR